MHSLNLERLNIAFADSNFFFNFEFFNGRNRHTSHKTLFKVLTVKHFC